MTRVIWGALQKRKKPPTSSPRLSLTRTWSPLESHRSTVGLSDLTGLPLSSSGMMGCIFASTSHPS